MKEVHNLIGSVSNTRDVISTVHGRLKEDEDDFEMMMRLYGEGDEIESADTSVTEDSGVVIPPLADSTTSVDDASRQLEAVLSLHHY